MQANIITVIPVYNGEKFIRQTLESVARQTLRPDRVIVQDNCSTDRTPEIAREFPTVRMLRQTNLGLAEIARQSGFRDAPSFCRLFRKRLKHTPTQYRRAKKSSI